MHFAHRSSPMKSKAPTAPQFWQVLFSSKGTSLDCAARQHGQMPHGSRVQHFSKFVGGCPHDAFPWHPHLAQGTAPVAVSDRGFVGSLDCSAIAFFTQALNVGRVWNAVLNEQWKVNLTSLPYGHPISVFLSSHSIISLSVGEPIGAVDARESWGSFIGVLCSRR